MWLSKKPAEPTPEELAEREERERREAAEAELRRKITAALEKEPLFQVVTVDGTNWICPYTLELVPAAFGHVEPAREHLLAKRPFANGAKPRPLADLLRRRWSLHLQAQIEYEPRLRISGPDQRWLNPWTGEWTKLGVAPSAPPHEVLAAMALALATCAPANSGKAMLELGELRAIEQRMLRATSTGPASDAAAVGASKRVSGRNAGAEGTIGADDLSRAKGILERMLDEMPSIPGFGLSVHYEPHDQVGGDFFACLPLGGGRWLLAVADVAGHGVQGALVVVAALKALRFIVRETQDLAGILERLNESLKADLLKGQFVTCWMGILHAAEMRVDMAFAGHHATVIANPASDTLVRRIHAKSPALGILPSAAFRAALRVVTCRLEPGDMLMQCTDGLLEASDPHRQEFGELRAAGSLLAHAEDGYADAVDRIAMDGRRFSAGTFQDDITVLVLQCAPPQAAAAEPGDPL